MKPCRRPPLTIPIVVLAAVQPASAQLPEGPTWTAEGAQSGARFGVAVASAGDVNGNGVDDEDEVAGGSAADCNANGVPDSCDVAAGTSADVNGNGVPDECECARSS